jgi:hypothetical protein
MQMFVTNKCPVKSAYDLSDQVAYKIAQETEQVLNYALTLCGGPAFLTKKGQPYSSKSAHARHPITQWVCKSRANYEWAIRYCEALCDEHLKRYGRKLQFTLDKLPVFKENVHFIPEGELTPFVNCCSDFRKDIANVHEAYQLEIIHKLTNEYKRVHTHYGKPYVQKLKELNVI